MKTLSRMCLLAGMAMATSSAFAVANDAVIRISRALNSPTITVKYDGATAAMIELRVNGKSVATRDANPEIKAGESNFTIDLSTLAAGDNRVEVILYDEAGKMLGSQSSVITIEDHTQTAVYLKAPAVGQTVQGLVKIDVGFGRTFKSPYISFFVNEQWKFTTNFPPYTYTWDTTREKNGWHDVEAWIVDETSNTFKTRKTRVFVNNPGGRTDRVTPIQLKPTDPPTTTPPTNDQTNTTVKNSGAGNTEAVVRPPQGTPPTTRPTTAANDVNAQGNDTLSGVKPSTIGNTTAAGAQNMTPTGQRTVAIPTTINVASPVAVTTNTLARVGITKGTRLADGPITILLDSSIVKFDVEPRIEEGIPLTPFRHLVEHSGGNVQWHHDAKVVTAEAHGKRIWLKIGEKTAMIDGLSFDLERGSFLDRNRTIVPLSFMRDVLDVDIEFDPGTGHVLITSLAKSKK